MQSVIHRAETRGGGDLGWLRTSYSFSFSEWRDPRRMGFGALRVLNDDWIAPRTGFGEHAHQNFEIITIVRKGAVTHTDSIGNRGVVREGEVQVMSAGTGVRHAELNQEGVPLELFQIWISPNVRQHAPRYDQKTFLAEERANTWQTVVSDGSIPGSLAILQDARIALIDIDPKIDSEIQYELRGSNFGVYLMVIEGDVSVLGQTLKDRDAIGISDGSECSIHAHSPASLLLIEVPML